MFDILFCIQVQHLNSCHITSHCVHINFCSPEILWHSVHLVCHSIDLEDKIDGLNLYVLSHTAMQRLAA